jgi:hypothetical protein
MTRSEIRRVLREYASLGFVQAHVVYEVGQMVEMPFGKLYTAANGSDGITALAAVLLLLYLHEENGWNAIVDLAQGDSFFGRLYAGKILERADYEHAA